MKYSAFLKGKKIYFFAFLETRLCTSLNSSCCVYIARRKFSFSYLSLEPSLSAQTAYRRHCFYLCLIITRNFVAQYCKITLTFKEVVIFMHQILLDADNVICEILCRSFGEIQTQSYFGSHVSQQLECRFKLSFQGDLFLLRHRKMRKNIWKTIYKILC